MTINVRNEYDGHNKLNSITHLIEITPDELMWVQSRKLIAILQINVRKLAV